MIWRRFWVEAAEQGGYETIRSRPAQGGIGYTLQFCRSGNLGYGRSASIKTGPRGGASVTVSLQKRSKFIMGCL